MSALAAASSPPVAAAADAVFVASEVAARVKKLRARWLGERSDAKTWKGADALVVVHGKRNTTNPNAKPLLFQRYLLTIGTQDLLLCMTLFLISLFYFLFFIYLLGDMTFVFRF